MKLLHLFLSAFTSLWREAGGNVDCDPEDRAWWQAVK